jgi:CDP-4-dehydro-6-deoxyglucose reductase
MARLVTVSRAAKLAGVSRGNLQRRIREGELQSFEGMVDLGEVSQIYPAAAYEDNSILERLDRIIENASIRARNRTTTIPPDMETLAARVNILSDELVEAKLEISIFHNIFDKLKSRLNKLASDIPQTSKTVHELQAWLLGEIESIADRKFAQYPLIAADTILRIVAAQVHLVPSGHEFFVEGSDSILESGLSAGLAMNYGCSNGNCGKCKAKLISGEIKKIRSHDYVLSEKEKLQGYFLTCSNTAVTDIAIEAEEAGNENEIPVQQLSAWVRKTSDANENMRILNLKTPRTQRLRFLAGQAVKLEIPDVASTTLHVGSCPCDDMNLQFHIDRSAANGFTDYIFSQLKTNEMINIEGPHGHFVLREDEPNPIIFIAFGGGFAPVKSLLEHAMTLDVTEHIHLYWSVADENSLYMHNQCRSWDDAFDRFDYTPVIGEQNLIDTVKTDHKNLPDYHFYIAGPEQQVNTTKSALLKHGASPDVVFTEIVEPLN